MFMVKFDAGDTIINQGMSTISHLCPLSLSLYQVMKETISMSLIQEKLKLVFVTPYYNIMI